jgi:nicotinamidase-related amidase
MARNPDLLGRSALLVVIDVQERVNRAMADQRHVACIRTLVRAFAVLGRPVLVTEQYPQGLGRTVPEIAALVDAPPITKESFSCAGEPAFLEALASLRPAQVLLTGVEAHVCVAQTALDLLAAGHRVHVPHDAVSSRRPVDRRWAMDRLARAGVVVTCTESALFEMVERCATEEFRLVSRLVKELPL